MSFYHLVRTNTLEIWVFCACNEYQWVIRKRIHKHTCRRCLRNELDTFAFVFLFTKFWFFFSLLSTTTVTTIIRCTFFLWHFIWLLLLLLSTRCDATLTLISSQIHRNRNVHALRPTKTTRKKVIIAMTNIANTRIKLYSLVQNTNSNNNSSKTVKMQTHEI